MHDQETKRIMQRYATILRRALTGGEELTLQAAGTKMRRQAGFSEAMSDAKLTGVGALLDFIRLFPEFSVNGKGQSQKVSLAAPTPEPAPGPAAEPPQTPASSSSGLAAPQIRIVRLPPRRRRGEI